MRVNARKEEGEKETVRKGSRSQLETFEWKEVRVNARKKEGREKEEISFPL